MLQRFGISGSVFRAASFIVCIKKQTRLLEATGLPQFALGEIQIASGQEDKMHSALRIDALLIYYFRALLAQHSGAFDPRFLFCATLRTYRLGTQSSAGDEPMA